MFNTFWESLPQLTIDEPIRRGVTPPRRPGQRAHASLEARRKAEAAEAQTTLAEAQDQAHRMLEEAHEEAGRLYAEARERGFARGAEEATAAAEARLTAEFNERIEALTADLNTVIELVEAERVAMWTNADKEILAFSMDVSRKILRTEVQQNKGAILDVIRHSLRRVVDKDQLRIRVNPDELEHVRSQRDDLLLLLDGARNLEIIDDRRIDPGGCVIETASGTIDAKVDTQIEQIVRALEIEQ